MAGSGEGIAKVMFEILKNCENPALSSRHQGAREGAPEVTAAVFSQFSVGQVRASPASSSTRRAEKVTSCGDGE
jgi:hypothetical protein